MGFSDFRIGKPPGIRRPAAIDLPEGPGCIDFVGIHFPAFSCFRFKQVKISPVIAKGKEFAIGRPFREGIKSCSREGIFFGQTFPVLGCDDQLHLSRFIAEPGNVFTVG